MLDVVLLLPRILVGAGAYSSVSPLPLNHSCKMSMSPRLRNLGRLVGAAIRAKISSANQSGVCLHIVIDSAPSLISLMRQEKRLRAARPYPT